MTAATMNNTGQPPSNEQMQHIRNQMLVWQLQQEMTKVVQQQQKRPSSGAKNRLDMRQSSIVVPQGGLKEHLMNRHHQSLVNMNKVPQHPPNIFMDTSASK